MPDLVCFSVTSVLSVQSRICTAFIAPHLLNVFGSIPLSLPPTPEFNQDSKLLERLSLLLGAFLYATINITHPLQVINQMAGLNF